MSTAKPSKGDALLIIDMINTFAFEDGAALSRSALSIADALHGLRTRFHRQRLPVIYVNDNFGRWRLGFEELLRLALRPRSRGAAVARKLHPTRSDLFVLKPRHSVFYETPLPSLLETLRARRLVLTGIAGDSCVLSSAMETHTRGFDLWVPSNTVASLTEERTARTLAYVRESLGGETAGA
jgi:nicotinamidase-related amidase